MASIRPERRHPALSIQTKAAHSRSTCSLALYSRCQRCVLVARVIKTDESLLYMYTGHLRFTTLDTKAYEASAICNEFNGDTALKIGSP
jgi:hypothetical protein